MLLGVNRAYNRIQWDVIDMTEYENDPTSFSFTK